jgi:hypothetical protein
MRNHLYTLINKFNVILPLVLVVVALLVAPPGT